MRASGEQGRPFSHTPVMLKESLQMMNLRPGMRVVDCTVGGGGHAGAFLKAVLPTGHVIGIDQDSDALSAADKALADICRDGAVRDKPYTLVHSNFVQIDEVMGNLGLDSMDAVFMDLGVSSHQLDEGDRGFSYRHPGDLDMRMDARGTGRTAYEVVMNYSARELEDILWKYGQERWSRRIARFIVEEREQRPIKTTEQLVSVIKKAVPAAARDGGPHPARRSFQALRIYINRELEVLEKAIAGTVKMLAPQGRIVIIGYHSLEDRVVKAAFRTLSVACTCVAKGFPVCICGGRAQGKVLTTKPLLPTQDEVETNPRSRSAKLRAFEKN